MKLVILAVAAVLPSFGGAYANDFSSTLQYPSAGVISSRQIYGDAAPRSIARNPRKAFGFSSTAPVRGSAAPGKISSRYVHGDATLPSKIYNAPNGFGFSSAASVGVGTGPTRPGTSPRILYGSN